MHIKNISIEGFKSYKTKTTIEFNKGSNIIVGKNGSGKSNIFSAIEFVLSDKFCNLSTEDRYRIIYENSERQFLAASVEIVFDNTDMRFPVNSNEVSIQRVLGVKKDEYFFNGKHSTRSNIESLLESAGISRSNTYFIVQQGKVNGLIKMKDKERLDLLKEIAGTRVYEDKRKECITLIEDSNTKNRHFTEIVDSLEKRINELKGEKSELTDFQEIDKKRRSIELCIYSIELEKIIKKIDEYSKLINKTDEKVAKSFEQKENAQKKVKTLDEEHSKLKDELNSAEMSRKKDSAMKRRYLKTISGLDQNKERAESISVHCKKLIKEFKEEKTKLEEKETEEKGKLEKILQKCKKAEEKEKEEEESSEPKRRRLEYLQSKCGRKDSFGSKSKRDEFLKKQILVHKERAEMDKNNLEELTRKVNIIGTEKQEAEVKRLRKEIETTEEQIVSLEKKYLEKLEKKNGFSYRRKEIWKDLSKLKKELKNCQDEKRRVVNELRFSMSYSQFNALQAVRKIVAEKKIKGYYGYFGELFNVKNQKFYKCVEKVAGNRLFFHVVENDKIASEIIDEMNKLKIGRVTIMPLSQLSHIRQPRREKNADVISILDQLEFDEKFAKPMAQVFGKTLIARNLEVAAKFAKEKNLDAITLDGDRAMKKGALSGGFSEHRSSRLKTIQSMRTLEENQEKYEIEENLKEGEENETEKTLRELTKELNCMEWEKEHLQKLLKNAKNELYFAEKELNAIKEEFCKNRNMGKILKSSIKQSTERIADFEKEKKSEFVTKLSNSESEEMSNLLSFVQDKDNILETLRGSLFELNLEKRRIENFQNLNLDYRKKEISTNLESNERKEKRAEFTLRRVALELEEYKELQKETEEKLKSISKKRWKNTNRSRALRSEESDSKQQLKEAEISMNEAKSAKSQLAKTEQIYSSKRDELEEKIKSVGFVDNSMKKRYEGKKIDQLIILLRKANGELKEFPDVNKKALDQFLELTGERDKFLQRKKDQDEGKTALKDLLKHLDKEKGEAINNTFNTIALYFSKVFSELAPGGSASLSIVREENGNEKSIPLESSPTKFQVMAGNFKGVSIDVSFTSKTAAKLPISSLSGGQQTLVSLALIFAIQRCDPTPFYCLDEIDANLDSSHRAAVADLLRKLCELPTQLISTTFKPEALSFADQCFIVSFERKVSCTRKATAEEASELILGREEDLE